MRPVRQTNRGRCARDFFHRNDVREITHRGAAEFFFDSNTEDAEGAHLAPQIHRELVGAVDFGSARRDFGLRELLDGFAQGGDVFAMVKGQAGQMDHVVLHFQGKITSGFRDVKSYLELTFT